MKKALTLALAVAAAGGTMAAQAYEAGDWILRAGAVTVAPDADSDEVPILGVTVDVDDDTQLSIIPVYMVDSNWGIELLAATPFKHDIEVNEAPIDAGSTKHLPPTLTIQWYPRGAQDGWQPYIGLGVNYTTFFSEKTSSDLDAVLGDELGATGSDLDLDDSFGLSASAGVDIPLGENWSLNAGIWYIDIDTTAEVTAKFEDGSRAKVKFDVDIDPWVYNIGIAYRF
jgi:outer membrane protein